MDSTHSVTPTAAGLELLLFDFCPYGQRAYIAALQGEVPMRLTVLDPDKLPENFAELSPLGYVPLLQVAGREVLFESAVISEYLASQAKQRLLPEDPLALARMRAWIEFGSACQGGLMQLLQAEDRATCQQRADGLLNRMDHLAGTLTGGGPYHSGSEFSLIDAAYAPFFQRLRALTRVSGVLSEERLPGGIRDWMDALENTPSVQNSIIGDFDQVFHGFIARKAAHGHVYQTLVGQ